MEAYIESFLSKKGESLLSLKRLENGFSNETYLLNSKYAVRLKKPSDPSFYWPHMEEKILKAASAAHLAPHLLDFSGDNGNKADEYIAGAHYFPRGEEVSKNDLALLAETLRKLHAIKGYYGNFRYFERYEAYQKEAGSSLDPELEETLKKEVSSFFGRNGYVLSHNDLWADNILLKGSKVYLLDFEFAGGNDELFDLVSLIGENFIIDQGKIEFFLKAYFGTAYQKSRYRDFLTLLLSSHFLWYYWAEARYKATDNPEFQRIAAEKAQLIAATKVLYFKQG